MDSKMSGSGRKRSSKWDSGDGSEFAPDSKQLRSGWSSEDAAGSKNSKRPYMEGNDKLKHGLAREPFSGGRGSNKDDIMHKDYRGMDAKVEWEADASYSKKISPGFDEQKHHKHSLSPKNVRIRSGRNSRSRSPPHGSRLDSGVNDRNRMRAGGSTQICKDFSAGKCRRGSHCHFLHHDDHNYEDSWESKNRDDGTPRYSDPHERRDHSVRSVRSNEACIHFAKGRCRNGASCRYVHHDISDGYGKGSVDELTRERENDGRRRDNYFEQGSGHVPNRSADTPCKFFANGNCRNGQYCRFSHDMQTCRSPNRRLRDDKWGSNPGGDHQSLHRPKLSDSFSPNGRLRTDRYGLDGTMSDADKVWDSPKRNDIVAVSDSAKLVEDKSGNMGATDRGLTVWPTRDALDHSLDNSRLHGEPPFSCDKKEADHWIAENAGSIMQTPQTVGIDIWPGDAKMSPDWNYRVGSSSHIEEKEHEQNNDGLTPGSMNLAATEHDRLQVTPGQDFNQNVQDVDALDSSSCHAIEQSQVAAPNLPSKAGVIEGLQNQDVSAEKKYTVEPNIMDSGSSQISSRIPSAQEIVRKEQLAQLSNLSASLAHILGSGQQLPQLYAALNSRNVKDPPSLAKTEVPTTTVSNTLVKPNPGVGFPKQYDSKCDTLELKGAVASGFRPAISPSKKNAVDEDMPSLLSNPGKQNCGDSSKENNEVVAEERPNPQDDPKNTKENGPLEIMDRNGGPDEAKKPKDVKGIRAFKFSLVEFVKELLKPTWKEGQITKEDYKIIVKKVVDKVTGTIQEGHIPQTQEKIDQYLSFSKPKLNKLVQAYVEKVEKVQKAQ